MEKPNFIRTTNVILILGCSLAFVGVPVLITLTILNSCGTFRNWFLAVLSVLILAFMLVCVYLSYRLTLRQMLHDAELLDRTERITKEEREAERSYKYRMEALQWGKTQEIFAALSQKEEDTTKPDVKITKYVVDHNLLLDYKKVMAEISQLKDSNKEETK